MNDTLCDAVVEQENYRQLFGSRAYISVQWSRGVSSLGDSTPLVPKMAMDRGSFRKAETDDDEGMKATRQLADLGLVKDR